MKKLKKALSLTLALALSFTTAVPAFAAGGGPAISHNRGDHDYRGYHARAVNSYLCENKSGGLTRVEFIDEMVVIENYDQNFRYLSGRTIAPELPKWGGFFAGENYNFLIYGQDNLGEDNGREVIRVVKYSKDWQRLGSGSMYGGECQVYEIFRGASLRCAEYGGYLYILTASTAYAGSDGLHHQGTLSVKVQQNSMAVSEGYIGGASHSFNQYIFINSDGNIVSSEHGDGYPRTLKFQIRVSDANIGKYDPIGSTYGRVILDIPGKIGQNFTGCQLGGVAEVSQGYVAAYNYNGMTNASKGQVYYYFVHNGSELGNTISLAGPGNLSNPVLVPTGLNGGYLLWNRKVADMPSDNLFYVRYRADGTVGPVQETTGLLSDCQPIQYNGKVVWYVTGSSSWESDKSAPVFYQLDATGLTTTPANGVSMSDNPSQDVAFASTQRVWLNGMTREFKMYALKDENGDSTNYIKLRDLAYIIRGSKGQFDVGYDDGIVITPGQPYTIVGGEMSTPFTGNRDYIGGTQTVRIGDKMVELEAITLMDDNGGGYNYFKLRDLGKALNFYVGWSADRGVHIETDKPYSE